MQGSKAAAPPPDLTNELPPRQAKVIAASNIGNDHLASINDDDGSNNHDAVMEDNASIECNSSTASPLFEDIVASAASEDSLLEEFAVLANSSSSSVVSASNTFAVENVALIEICLPMEIDMTNDDVEEIVEESARDDDKAIADDVTIHTDCEPDKESRTLVPKPEPRDMLTTVDMRRLILHLYLNMNAPLPERWNGKGKKISFIMRTLQLAKTQRGMVV